MTLAEVAKKIRDDSPFDGSTDQAIKALEKDPDWTLRERVEALAKELESQNQHAEPSSVWSGWVRVADHAHRLRELLEGK